MNGVEWFEYVYVVWEFLMKKWIDTYCINFVWKLLVAEWNGHILTLLSIKVYYL